MTFAAGLEQFGALGGLDWEKEFEDLVSTRSTTEDDLDASDAMCTVDMSTKTTESELFSLKDDCDTDLVIVGSYQLAPTDDVISAKDTVMEHAIHLESPVPLPLEEGHFHTPSVSQILHSGWSKETPSWYQHTATSPLRYVANNDDDQPSKCSQSAPSLVFLSGENYLDPDVEMSQSMETGEITIQEYEQESDQDAGEEIELSPEEPIGTHFEIEINARTVPSNIVDQDDEHLSASSEETRSWPSSPPLPSRELDSPVIIYDDETVGLINDETTCDLPKLALAANYKISELDLAQDLDSAPFYSAYHASENFVETDWGSLDEDSDECGPELPELDHITTTLNGDEIDQAISRLKSMSSVSLNEFVECKRESGVSCTEYAPSTDGLPSIVLPEPPEKGADDSFNLTSHSPMVVDLSDVPRARSTSHSSPTVGTDSSDAIAKAPPVVNSARGLAKKPCSEGFQGSSQIAERGVGIANIIGAVCHTIWSICSANPVSVFLF